MKMLFRLLVTVLTALIFVVPLVLLAMWVVADPQPLRLVGAGFGVILLLLMFYFILSSSPLSTDKSTYRCNEKMRITLRNAHLFHWDDLFSLERVGEQWETVEFAPQRAARPASADAVTWEAVAPEQPGTYWLSKTVSLAGDAGGRTKTFRVRLIVNNWSVRIGS